MTSRLLSAALALIVGLTVGSREVVAEADYYQGRTGSSTSGTCSTLGGVLSGTCLSALFSNGTTINPPSQGGTGVNNGTNTLILGNGFTTIKVASTGDSVPARSSDNYYSAPQSCVIQTGCNYYPRGVLTNVRFLTDQRVQFPISLNYAVGGTTTVEWLSSQLPAAIASDADVIDAQIGTNDAVASGRAALAITTNMETGYKLILAGGKKLIVEAIQARGDYSAPQRQTIEAVRQWQIQFCRAANQTIHRCMFVDQFKTTVDPASASSFAKAGYMVINGVHPTTLAAFREAQKWVQSFYAMFPQLGNNGLVADLNDTYVGPASSSFPNQYGNMHANGLMNGSGGTFSGSILSGTAATSWTCAYSGSSTLTGTIVGSQVAAADGVGQWQDIVFTNVAAGIYGEPLKCFQLLNQSDTLNYTTGDVVLGEGQVWFNGAFVTPGLLISDHDGCDTLNASNDGLINPTVTGEVKSDYGAYPAGEDIYGVKMTEPITIRAYCGSGSRQLELSILVYFDASTAFTGHLRFRGMASRKVNVLP